MTQAEKEDFRPPEQSETQDSTAEDYVFRFPLEPEELPAVYEDPLLELVRGFLADVLDCVVLTYHGKRVMVDGFRLLQDMETEYRIFPDRDLSAQQEHGKP